MKRSLSSKCGDRHWLVPCLIALAGCTGTVDGPKNGVVPPGSSGAGSTTTVPGGGASNGTGGSGSGSSGTGNVPTGGAGQVSNGGASGAATTPPLVCPDTAVVPRAPMRRLTQFEYNNTLSDLKLDSTNLAIGLPSEDLGNGFGNDADSQSVPSELVKKYEEIAETIAANFTTPAALAGTLPCAASATATTEAACARTFVGQFAPQAFRRPLDAGEAEGFVTLFQAVRAMSGSTFNTSLAAVVEAIAQDPAFLYKPEFGVAVPGRTDLMRPNGYEMATRLSYLLWGTTPDAPLIAAAASGALDTAAGVSTRATMMLSDARAKNQTRFFFDNLLPIASLNQLTRDAGLFPNYTSKLGALMRQETETFLEHLIFDGTGGTWPSAFTANYTWVNADLATFYGMTGVTGTAFQKVPVDTTKRLGLLSQAGMVAGTIHSNETNPVVRGGLVVRKLLCQAIPLPTGAIQAMVMIPPADANKTARQRYTAHSMNPVCHACHTNMDPVGFAFENYDPIGQWRDQENGVTIDASGSAPALGDFNGPAQLAQRMSEAPAAETCFAANWLNFGYGRTITATGAEGCIAQAVQDKFKTSGYNIQQLLLSLTQSDAFLYLPAVRE